MRIDAHQHFWDLDRLTYPWIPPAPSRLRRNFLPEDLRPILARNHFDGSVAVQAATVAEEASWLLELSEQHAFILGVVAWVDLTDERVGDRLEKLQRHPKFKGTRHPVQDESDERWLLQEDVIRGLKELERRRIPYDLLLRPRHLGIVPELVDRVPELPLVLDHLGKPNIAEGVFEPWARDMERIAALPHVHVKLSGMITEARPNQWTAEDLRPYVEFVLKRFGPDRCMFGSDWPVCLVACSWKEVLSGFTQAHGPLPKELRSKIMGETAARFYDLSVAANA